MINYFHSRLHRPERGWDPVPTAYAQKYADSEWRCVNEALLDELDRWIGGMSGKRILDLGGGPGQYSVSFAQRGADVTWYDVSRTYRDMAQKKAKEHGVEITFSLGYLDEAAAHLQEPFDLVFNRICWNYGFNDSSFADVVFTLVKPGGAGYVDTTHSGFKQEELSLSARFRTWLNAVFSIKIGHPFPPHGRLAELFLKKAVEKLLVNYSSPWNDRIIFIKNQPATRESDLK